ncbi:MAG TPA: chemotaxis protein CheB [Thermoclostridium caenicola]|nr:chemotaxis protein CheB [Thermoclostridium caenicola]
MAQDESTSIVFGMPKVAIESGVVDDIAPLMEIPNRILKYMGVRQ